jgi:hypothetical protein
MEGGGMTIGSKGERNVIERGKMIAIGQPTALVLALAVGVLTSP